MNDKNAPPALTDPKGMGGVIAQDGFAYQLWDGISRIPHWLANPAFEEMIFEGLEDLEARFFAPQAPPHFRVLERFQAKSSDLLPADVKEVLQSFHHFDESYPRIARVQTLVTPRLPKTLAWLRRDSARVRRARPFFAPFADVSAATDARLVADLRKEYGNGLGDFVARAVEIEERVLPDRSAARSAFAIALQEAFPLLEVSTRRTDAAFEALVSLADRHVGHPLHRDKLRHAVESGLGERLPLPAAFPLMIRSDRLETDETAFQIDASEFSGGLAPFPESKIWGERLVEPLGKVAKWLRGRGISRVSVLGSYRLSTGMLVGASFRSAVGFELEIATRSGIWSTDEHTEGARDQEWTVTRPTELHEGRLAVTIGVLRDPGVDLLETAGAPASSVLRMHLPVAIADGQGAQAAVGFVKKTVAESVTRLAPRSIDLYLAGPAAFAVALGHRWNAMPPTQLHEFIAPERRYVQTGSI
jgi:hypothetical protein